jgi:quinoprotein glucose dehydrogenase
MIRGVGSTVPKFVRAAVVFVAIPVLIAATRRSPQPAPARRPLAAAAGRSVWDSVFTAEQAKRGQAAFKQTCAKCHLETLAGLDDSPALTGAAFLAKWYGQTLGDLQDRIRTTMPSDDPGTLSRPLITDVIAYLLSFNSFPAGKSELSPALDSLSDVRIEASRP